MSTRRNEPRCSRTTVSRDPLHLARLTREPIAHSECGLGNYVTMAAGVYESEDPAAPAIPKSFEDR